jgi:DUF1016 N-terminal domain
MAKSKNNKKIVPEDSLLIELSQLIEQSRQQLVSQANSSLTLLFWHIGKRINTEILKNKRAEYSKQIVSTLSTQLKNRYGKNFEERNLRRMLQFAEQFDENEIIVSLSRQLSWSHFVELLPLKNKAARLFYAQISTEPKLLNVQQSQICKSYLEKLKFIIHLKILIF